MTVAQLIAALQDLPPDSQVLVDLPLTNQTVAGRWIQGTLVAPTLVAGGLTYKLYEQKEYKNDKVTQAHTAIRITQQCNHTKHDGHISELLIPLRLRMILPFVPVHEIYGKHRVNNIRHHQ